MINLYSTSQVSSVQKNENISNFGVKNIQIKNRHYSNSRLSKANQTQEVNLESTQPLQKIFETNKNKVEIQKYSINRIKVLNSGQKISVRKNSSLKAFKTQNSIKFEEVTEDTQLSKNIQSWKMIPTLKNSLQTIKETIKDRTVSIKRRLELIKKSQNSLKIVDRKPNIIQTEVKSENFIKEESLQFLEFKQNLKRSENKIKSETYMRQGLKKSPTSKIKILVKNPFEKRMRMDEEFKQSQILSKNEESFTSLSNRHEIEEILSMI